MPAGLSETLKKPSAKDSRPLALRPLAVRVRSIWPYSRWVWVQAMKSSSPHLLLGPQHQWYSPWEQGPFSLTLTRGVGDWIKTGFLTSSTQEKEQSSPYISTERMRVISDSLASL